MAREDELKALIEKKSTLQRGCRCLAAEFNSTTSAQLMPLVSRVYTLLKTRHTNAEFWRSGLQLFSACHQCSPLAPEHAAKIATFLKETQAFLDASDAAEPEASPEDMGVPQDPFDLLMGVGADEALHHESHFDDAGPIVDDSVRWARAQQSGAVPPAAAAAPAAAAPAATAATAADGTPQDNDAAAANDAAGAAGAADAAGAAGAADAAGAAAAAATGAAGAAGMSRREVQRQILEGIQAVYDGMAAVTRGTEAIERELDSVLQTIQDRRAAGQPRPVPPMSKRLLDSLPVVELGEDTLSELGADTRCAVCTDALQLGDKVFSLPCRGKHWFHPSCVRPWLVKTNSCPVCRDELPTDDHHYEANKEREREAAQERAGAANALSHNEFMYI